MSFIHTWLVFFVVYFVVFASIIVPLNIHIYRQFKRDKVDHEARIQAQIAFNARHQEER